MTKALLVVGHGTRDEAGAAAFRRFVARLRPGVQVGGGFIELSRPPLAEAVATLVAEGVTRFAAVPLVLVSAGHAKGDIPAALAREVGRHPGISFTYGRPIGPHASVLALLRERIAPRLSGDTAVLLVGRGSTDPDANAEVVKLARLLWETMPETAFVEAAFISLARPGVAAGLERCRRLGARRVVVAPYFLFPGVLPTRTVAEATAWGNHNNTDVVCTELLTGDALGDATIADIVTERYREALAGDLRMNCDTCVYRVPLAGFEAKVGAAAHPHHHPDDPHEH